GGHRMRGSRYGRWPADSAEGGGAAASHPVPCLRPQGVPNAARLDGAPALRAPPAPGRSPAPGVATPDLGEADDEQDNRPDDAEDDEPETEQHSTHGAARGIRPEPEIAAARDGGCTGRLDGKPARGQAVEGR